MMLILKIAMMRRSKILEHACDIAPGARKEYFGMSMFDRAENGIPEWLSGVFDFA